MEQILIEKVKAGDVFVTSWGYDQTNYDFIMVESISPSGKTAICKRAETEYLGAEGQNDKVRPKYKGYGKSFRMKVDYSSEYCLRGSYIYCGDEESESKRLDSFSKAENKEYYPTNGMFGH